MIALGLLLLAAAPDAGSGAKLGNADAGVSGESFGGVKLPVCADSGACQKSCAKKQPDACIQLGDFLIREPLRRADALAAYSTACDLGAARGCSKLGFRLIQSSHAKADVDRAVMLWTGACEKNDALGCSNLASFYMDGEGVPEDYAKAFSLATRACDGGDNFACGLVGTLWLSGKGAPSKDLKQAASFYDRGCKMGSPSSCTGYAYLLRFGAGIDKDVAKAVEMFTKSCEQNDPMGCINLAQQYEAGEGVAKDAQRAKELKAKACGLGAGEACE